MNYRVTLEDLDQRLNLDREQDAIVRFVIGVCRSMNLSGVAREAVEVAARYLSHDASHEGLERARVACWSSIRGKDRDPPDREVASTRAVICATFPREWRDDAFSVLDDFEGFATAAGVDDDDIVLALQRAFANEGHQKGSRVKP